MIIIKVNNPYYDREYKTDRTIIEWKGFINNHLRGNETIFSFISNDEVITINPAYFASVEVREAKP